MAVLQRAGATSFSFLLVIQGTQQTLWSTAQWPRKKTRHTMSFTHTHIQRHAHCAAATFGHALGHSQAHACKSLIKGIFNIYNMYIFLFNFFVTFFKFTKFFFIFRGSS